MSSKLEILTQVMLSLKNEQSDSMHNINVLLRNSNLETDLFKKIKDELGILSSIHSKMQECESFIIQLTKDSIQEGVLKNETDSENK